MQTQPASTEKPVIYARSDAATNRSELKPLEIYSLLTQVNELSAEGLELVEIRYQQGLALMNLGELFGEAQFRSR